ncbi:unnamed protein product [Acanthoscelides obtectus]|uniref:Uncharacterized protein n=1 Tax=Acanthoscelides obtectus TaxID=200917 RepID=A0A9P0PA21_ACAOB|nr:unnamed protein product [Acanthoscelides obtectus]CAK1664763.1 hypothetical protein AOBTE_LOCUS24451 [Acanthoscelides obtectus]
MPQLFGPAARTWCNENHNMTYPVPRFVSY